MSIIQRTSFSRASAFSTDNEPTSRIGSTVWIGYDIAMKEKTEETLVAKKESKDVTKEVLRQQKNQNLKGLQRQRLKINHVKWLKSLNRRFHHRPFYQRSQRARNLW